MIISRTPLRISFFSGGSDLPSFYKQDFGAALSVTIDKYVYVFFHEVQNHGFKTMFDNVQNCDTVDEINHDITREALKLCNYSNTCTITSISDVLSRGSGLGSSSAFTVGLLKCLEDTDKTEMIHPMNVAKDIAEKACTVEIDMCGFPIGKQDQYAAAYGGLNLFIFDKNGSVTINPVTIDRKHVLELQENLLLVYSGRGREAAKILAQQSSSMSVKDKYDLVRNGRDKALYADSLLRVGKIDDIGHLLHEAWLEKKQIVNTISNDYFDSIYRGAIEAGALGGKLLGAGGGGFFLFYVRPEKRNTVIEFITRSSECKIYDFNFVTHGSTRVSL